MFTTTGAQEQPLTVPEPADEPYPLVVFSHGFSLSPIVYGTLVEHYASQGYVVLAAEHNEGFDGSLPALQEELIDRPVDISRTIDHAKPSGSGAPLDGMIDLDNTAVVGHSYGGYTALAAAGAVFDSPPTRTAEQRCQQMIRSPSSALHCPTRRTWPCEPDSTKALPTPWARRLTPAGARGRPGCRVERSGCGAIASWQSRTPSSEKKHDEHTSQ